MSTSPTSTARWLRGLQSEPNEFQPREFAVTQGQEVRALSDAAGSCAELCPDLEPFDQCFRADEADIPEDAAAERRA